MSSSSRPTRAKTNSTRLGEQMGKSGSASQTVSRNASTPSKSRDRIRTRAGRRQNTETGPNIGDDQKPFPASSRRRTAPDRKYKRKQFAKNGADLFNLPYEQGYGRPPEKGKFKPGQSGNPKGRPKGAKTIKDAVRKALSKEINYRQGDKTQKVPLRTGIALRLVHKALNGDPNSIKFVIAMDDEFELVHPEEAPGSGSQDMIDEIDAQLLKEFEDQIRQSSCGTRQKEEDEGDDDA